MKTTFNKVMQAAVAATALTFASVAYATPDYYTATSIKSEDFNPDSSTSVYFGGIKEVFGMNAIGVSIYEVASANNSTEKYYAYCIQPTVDYKANSNYAINSNFVINAPVRQLFESAYAGSLTDSTKEKAFQLALWELQNDDGNLRAGNMSFAQNDGGHDVAIDAAVNMAEQMLATAANFKVTTEHYNYLVFESGVDSADSQRLLGVSAIAAVPEADTWAMMAVGMGLVGLVGRRKQKNEKFA